MTQTLVAQVLGAGFPIVALDLRFFHRALDATSAWTFAKRHGHQLTDFVRFKRAGQTSFVEGLDRFAEKEASLASGENLASVVASTFAVAGRPRRAQSVDVFALLSVAEKSLVRTLTG